MIRWFGLTKFNRDNSTPATGGVKPSTTTSAQATSSSLDAAT